MTTAIAPLPLADYQLVATDRNALQAAHLKMIEWAKAKIEQTELDVDIEETNHKIALENGWVVAPFERRLSRLARQRTFYTKILQAVEAGYAIVPNFQMNIFAVRTTAQAPRQGVREGSAWQNRNAFEQHAQRLPAGEGVYRNPVPDVYQDRKTEKTPTGDVTKYTSWPGEEFNDLAFPLALAKPALMSATGEAMARKIFDEIGVAVDTWSPTRGGGRADPIILGRLLNPRRGRPAISFFVGWYFDPSRL